MAVFGLLLVKELRFWFRRPGVHIFAGLFFLLGFLTMLSIGGAVEFIRVGGMGGLTKADSPTQFTEFTLVFALFATMNFAAASGGSATRDVSEGMHALVYSTPVPKTTFLLTRYLGALAVSAYLTLGIPVGLVIGSQMPFMEAERVGAFAPLNTLASLLVWVGPNVVFTTALFFAIGALTRRMFPIYIGGVFLFVGYLGASAFLQDLDDRSLGVMLDPFGLTGISEVTRYWTPIENNTLVPWPTGASLANRITWSLFGLGSLGAALVLARLDQAGWNPLARFQRKDVTTTESDGDVAIAVPASTRQFSGQARFVQLVALTRRALSDVIGHRYFWAFVGAALLFELINSQAIGSMYGTDTWPVTYQVLEIFEGTLGIFLLVILTFYAGDLVWTERDLGQAQLVDSAPLPDWLPLIAKATALTAVIIGLHTTILAFGPLVQLYQGYTSFELGLYSQALYGFSLLDWLPFVAMSLAAHAIANSKIAGHGLLVGFWGLTIFRSGLGFEHNLFWVGSDPGRTYSDMNAWGATVGPFLTYKVYWLGFAIVMLGLARLAWVRGTDAHWRNRLAEARRRFDRPTAVVLASGAAITLGLGSYIAVLTNVVGTYQTTVDGNRDRAEYERRYKAEWEGAPHPIVTDVTTTVDLFPSEGRASLSGTLQLVNPHDEPITKMLVSVPRDEPGDTTLTFGKPYTETHDEKLDLHVWTLGEPLAPGERTTLDFEVEYRPRGMPNSGFETAVVANGTFLHHNNVFPSFGYNRGAELSDPADRRTYELPERDRMFELDDPRARLHNYITDDAHRVSVETRISTEKGQIPLAPGDLVDQGEDGDRVWRLYRIDEPILYFFAYLSADWEMKRDTSGPVPVEVYYHPAHTYNVDRMLEGMVASVEMFERDFGPFQHNVLRIVEFPRYATFAQSFPTMVPFSEGIGFIARLTEPDEDIDYVYYVTAHEVAHQWWAHQVCGGDGQGATVLTESMSQYGALKVMEAEYGKEQIQRFLEYESDGYFGGRSNERDEEHPLMRVENQQYIHYQKGGIVLYTLSERVGRERFDAAIRSFLAEWKFVGPAYPTARDFVDHLKAELPEHVEAIEDGFERIVLYDLRVENPTATKTTGWSVTFEATAKKLVADGEGRETEEPFADTVGVLLTDVDGEEHRTTVEITGSGPVTVAFPGLVATPASIELDPRALFLERVRDDNEASVDATGA